jgi:hypothetical protein
VAIETCPDSGTALPQAQSGCSPKAWVRAARIGVELVLGAGLGALGELTGIYVGLNADILSGHDGGLGLSLGAAIGAMLSVAPAVWCGGAAMGGDGSFGWTMLGGAAGTVLSAGILAINHGMAAVVIAAAVPVIGSVLGYELSSHRKRGTATGVAIMPTLSPNGAGIAGVF